MLVEEYGSRRLLEFAGRLRSWQFWKYTIGFCNALEVNTVFSRWHERGIVISLGERGRGGGSLQTREALTYITCVSSLKVFNSDSVWG